MKVVECRTCNEPIFWVVTEKGKRMPLDVEPSATGKFVLEDEEEETPRALFRPRATEPRYDSHFSTCPQAKEWRR